MKIAGALLLAIIVAALLLPPLLPWGYAAIDWGAVRAPAFSPGHLLGTDSVGRDLLARTLAGTRVTLAVATAAALVALVIGTAWGAIAGWCGGADCEAQIKTETQATLRNIPFNSEPAAGTCVKCGQPAAGEAWFAKAY